MFLVGCPRSGTTLLQVLLNRHPGLVVPPELKLFHRFHRAVERTRRATIERLNRDLQVRLPLELACRHVSTASVYSEIFNQLRRRRPSRHDVDLVDKTPEHSFRLPWIREEYPNAKIIVLVRDPRDVAWSLSHVPWLDCSLIGGALIWRAAQRAIAEASTVAPRAFIWIRYESLVMDPVNTLRVILSRLVDGEEKHSIDPQQLLLRSPDDQWTIPSGEMCWKGRAVLPLDKSRVEAWRSRSPESGSLVESICQEEMQRCGYELSFQRSRRVGICRRTLTRARILRSIPASLLLEEARYQLWRASHA